MNRLVLESIESVDKFHDGTDRRVEHEALADVFRDLLDRLMQRAAQRLLLSRQRRVVVIVQPLLDRILEMRDDAPDAVQKAERPLDALVAPLQVTLDGSGEENEEARRIGAILLDDLLGGDDVALRLRHLRAVLDDHALRQEILERFIKIQKLLVAQHLREEARIEKVQNRMLDAADILIDRRPVVHLVRRKRLVRVMRIGVAHVVPRRADKGVHRVRLAPCGTAAFRACAVHEGFALRQRGNGALLEVHILGQLDGQFLFGNELLTALVAVDDGNRRTPVALARDEPIAQAIVDLTPAEAFLDRLFDNRRERLVHLHAVELRRIHEDAVLVRVGFRHFFKF